MVGKGLEAAGEGCVNLMQEFIVWFEDLRRAYGRED